MYRRSKQLKVQIIDIRKKWTPLLTKNARFENVPKNWAWPLPPTSFEKKIQKKALSSQENIYSEKLRPANSWLLHFHLCMSGKFPPSSCPFTSDEDQSRKNPGGDSQSCMCLWLDEGKWSGQLQHVRLLPAFSSTMSAWRCIGRQVNLCRRNPRDWCSENTNPRF